MVLGDGADNYNIIFTQITMDDTTRQISKAGSEMALPLFI
jgi:hypothetical protein